MNRLETQPSVDEGICEEHDDECRGDGWRTKSAGPLQCWISANRKEANCTFAVDLVAGRLALGSVC